ncbi:MlaD family protein [Vibrio sp. SCSIO 43136]|uniref:PqiB family protein n=1 Tax=Vibrio sp. SCSIO 43136 TaxID=2819101 RepID=UPI002075559D|nr:MlaD family protein [Vibrio sp. SCSIO 43136]USD66520.1 MCE family protein [Vibrio sp. SCSIO 43136]
MNSSNTSQSSHQPRVKRDFGVSPLWLLPLITLCLAGWLVFKAINEAGQRIQISFPDAQGMIAGRTTIRYQGLEVGMVRDIKLSKDLSNIFVEADIYPEATQLLGDKTRFWLVKPTASLSGVSGLDALVSGNYISIHPGGNTEPVDLSTVKTKYIGLDKSPSDLLADKGLNITLISDELGSISIGSQIVYKKIPIGEVFSFQLDENAKHVRIHAVIDDEYSNLINSDSRFWNVSGIGAKVGFNGVDIHMESLSALLGGAIAVDSPDEGDAVTEGSQFKLYPDLATAGRGIPIEIELPSDNKVSANGAPIMYRGLEIGQITDVQLSDDHEHIIAYASIQPSFSDALNSGTKFLLEEAKLSLSGVENIGNLLTGNYLTMIPGDGDRNRNFTAIRKDTYIRATEGALQLTLKADNTFGLEAGTELLYKGISVGSVTNVALEQDDVLFEVLVNHEYAHLIKANNRFFVTGSATAEFTETGLNVTVPPAKQLLSGSISFVSEGKSAPKSTYNLFANKSLAELADFNKSGSVDLTLLSDELPPVSVGSPLLYRNLPVGKVAGFKLGKTGVLIHLRLDRKYQHVLSKNSVFWNRSGVEVTADLSGVNITAAPLATLIKGGIAFDTLEGVENKIGKQWKLYDSYNEARKYGKHIQLTSNNTSSVTKGMPIKYQGVKVGEVTKVTPNFDSQNVQIDARILPEYVANIALNNSHFWLVQPEVGLRGVKNLETLISQYIQVEPAGKQLKYEFNLDTEGKGSRGVSYQLQSATRASVSVGTPVLFRDFEVGEVVEVRLGQFADRVVTTIEVKPQYAYLIRSNTVFWNVSGIDVSFGITGAEVRAGTVDNIVRGGIAFATPEQTPLKPEAQANTAFFLHDQVKPEWKLWRTPIPMPGN